jgi:hypothetical protein
MRIHMIVLATLLAGSLSRASVVFNTQTGDLDVSYEAAGTAHSFTVELPTQVVPRVTVGVVRQANDFYTYRYQLENGQTARQKLWNWEAVVDPAVQISAVTQPSPWSHDPIVLTPSDPTHRNYISPPGLYLRWSPKSGEGLLPGQIQGPFEIIAYGSPGFMRSFFSSYVERTAEDPIYLAPPDVFREIFRYLGSMEKSTVAHAVVGPAFSPSTTTTEKARILLTQVTAFIVSHELSSDSRFVESAIEALTMLASGGAAPGLRGGILPPKPGREGDLATVLRANFY